MPNCLLKKIKQPFLFSVLALLLVASAFLERSSGYVRNHQSTALTPIITIIVYLIIKLGNSNKLLKEKSIISLIGSNCFGVYALQPIFFEKTREFFESILYPWFDSFVFNNDFLLQSDFIESIINRVETTSLHTCLLDFFVSIVYLVVTFTLLCLINIIFKYLPVFRRIF